MLKDVLRAFSLLTGVPVAVEWPEDGVTHVADHFVVVGAVCGVLAAAVSWLLLMVRGIGTELVAVLVVVVLAAVTRGLHWDGLADVADAWTVGAERRREVMKDSRVGAFGVLAIVSVFAVQIASVISLDRRVSAVVVAWLLAPVFGRLSATFGAWLGSPMNPIGLGASVVRRPGAAGVAATLSVVGVVVATGLAFEPAVAAAAAGVGLLAALGVPHLLALRMGGVNGDVLGASILLTETVTLVAAASATAMMYGSITFERLW